MRDGPAVAEPLFAGVAGVYDRPAEILSFGRYGAWRRTLARLLPVAPGARVLDVATGTGLVARELARRRRVRVVGLDRSLEMLARATGRRIAGRAERLPFGDATFDAVVFTYLLRYVEDPAATIAECARVLRPGGALGSIEFGVPNDPAVRAVWRAYATGVFPALARLVSPGWARVGAFLPDSILEHDRALPPDKQAVLWRDAGIGRIRILRPTLGAGVVMIGLKDG